MESLRNAADEPAVRTLEQELGLIRSAIAMVASGSAPRVSLSGLVFGEQLLERARQLATEAGVRLVPLWTAEDAGAGVTIERLTSAGDR